MDQPCRAVALATEPGGATDIELVTRGSEPQRTGLESIQGHVFKWVDDQWSLSPWYRSPNLINLPGTRLTLEFPENVVAATATSDQWGSFTFCNLPPRRATAFVGVITATKTGFETQRLALNWWEGQPFVYVFLKPLNFGRE